MACYSPLKAIQGGVNSNGKRPLLFNVKVVDTASQIPIKVPCGQCIGCRLERSRQWAMRCMDEAQLHNENCFLTLTFSPEALEKRRSMSLDVRDLQLFWKRFRKESLYPLRYYACGEYGEKFRRPHYHACVFGVNFADKKFVKTTPAGFALYKSDMLSYLWPHGHSWIGAVTFESAAYVARYVMKKITGDDADEHYTDQKTGEINKPEFTVMSRGGSGGKGGIGHEWYSRFRGDVYPSGKKVVRGIEVKPPRYYDSLYERECPGEFVKMKEKRINSVDISENSPYRLLVKEEVKLAQIKNLGRSLEVSI